MTASPHIDRAKYRRLISRVLPMPIKTEQENDRILKEIEKLMDKGKLTPEEDSLFDLMVKLVEEYESVNYPMPNPTPKAMLEHLMDARGLTQADLAPVLGARSRVSEIFSGKRQISKSQAKALGLYFNIDPGVFI